MSWERTGEKRRWQELGRKRHLGFRGHHEFSVVRNTDDDRNLLVEVPTSYVEQDDALAVVLEGSSSDGDFQRLPLDIWDTRVNLYGELPD